MGAFSKPRSTTRSSIASRIASRLSLLPVFFATIEPVERSFYYSCSWLTGRHLTFLNSDRRIGSPLDSPNRRSRSDHPLARFEDCQLAKRDEHETANECESGKPKERAGIATGPLLQKTDDARSKETTAGTDRTDECDPGGSRRSFEKLSRQAPEWGHE